jgi:hypothetical protein
VWSSDRFARPVVPARTSRIFLVDHPVDIRRLCHDVGDWRAGIRAGDDLPDGVGVATFARIDR